MTIFLVGVAIGICGGWFFGRWHEQAKVMAAVFDARYDFNKGEAWLSSLVKRLPYLFKLLSFLLAALLAAPLAHANTPGKHSVSLSWTASTTTGVTYDLYRGSAAGVCQGTVTPYVTGITGTAYVDTTGLTDGETIYYNVSAVGTGGKESACDGELQVQIPVLPSPPAGLSATEF